MKWLAIISLLLVSGCSLRLFQDKVPQPIQKSASHKESERGAVYWLAENIEEPKEAQDVADVLSVSMGLPEKLETNATTIKNSLISNVVDHQKRQASQQEKLQELAGKKVEGTGLNILPSLSLFGVVGIVALCVFFPAILTIGGFLFKRVSGALKAIVKTIDEHEFEEPRATEKLKASLSANMDKAHKQLVDGLKR